MEGRDPFDPSLRSLFDITGLDAFGEFEDWAGAGPEYSSE